LRACSLDSQGVRVRVEGACIRRSIDTARRCRVYVLGQRRIRVSGAADIVP